LTLGSFEALLEDVERHVQGCGHLLLFVGEQLRLEITLLRHDKNPRVIWGLKTHEDWAFKATLLRFARGLEPVHLILSEEEGPSRIHGWEARRTNDSFCASTLPCEQAEQFWRCCLAQFSA
jgi:hypothetical protein